MGSPAESTGAKTFHHDCDRCNDGVVRIDMDPEQYVIRGDDAQWPGDDEAGRAAMEAAYGDWPGFEVATGTCDTCGTAWARATATALPRDPYAEELTFYRPLRCPACHHRFTIDPQCYPGEGDVDEKRLENYTAREIQAAGGEYYSLYMSKGVECGWNDACDVDQFYFKGKL
jgi:DNA-directed RNA polymerase subunit RPC12/RpoP